MRFENNSHTLRRQTAHAQTIENDMFALPVKCWLNCKFDRMRQLTWFSTNKWHKTFTFIEHKWNKVHFQTASQLKYLTYVRVDGYRAIVYDALDLYSTQLKHHNHSMEINALAKTFLSIWLLACFYFQCHVKCLFCALLFVN